MAEDQGKERETKSGSFRWGCKHLSSPFPSGSTQEHQSPDGSLHPVSSSTTCSGAGGLGLQLLSVLLALNLELLAGDPSVERQVWDSLSLSTKLPGKGEHLTKSETHSWNLPLAVKAMGWGGGYTRQVEEYSRQNFEFSLFIPTFIPKCET